MLLLTRTRKISPHLLSIHNFHVSWPVGLGFATLEKKEHKLSSMYHQLMSLDNLCLTFTPQAIECQVNGALTITINGKVLQKLRHNFLSAQFILVISHMWAFFWAPMSLQSWLKLHLISKSYTCTRYTPLHQIHCLAQLNKMQPLYLQLQAVRK